MKLANHAFRIFNRLMIDNSNHLFRGILRTPPVATDPSSNIMCYSLLCKRDVFAYLLAAKSFLRFSPPLNVVIQSDGSLDSHDCSLLRQHIKSVCILSRESTEEFLRARLDKGLLRLLADTNFCVELKLLNPICRFPGQYVVQFDSDLLFMRRPDAALDCMTSTPPRAFHSPGGNVLAEPFEKIGFDFSRSSIRSFNSGFMGCSMNFDEAKVLRIGTAVRAYDPQLLKVWDLEQALWSVLMNEFEDPLNLGEFGRQYVGNGWANYASLRDVSTLIHFVGATRFRNLMYVRLGRQVMSELQMARGG